MLTEHTYKIPKSMPFVLRKLLVVCDEDLHGKEPIPHFSLWFYCSIVWVHVNKESLPLTM